MIHTNVYLEKIQCLFWFMHIIEYKKTKVFIVLLLCPQVLLGCNENTAVNISETKKEKKYTHTQTAWLKKTQAQDMFF